MPITIQTPIKTSRFKSPQCFTKSALDKNLKAIANSKKPRTTFTEFNQPPDFGSEFNHFGNIANKVNGNANAKPKPDIPIVNCIAPPSLVKDPANREPRIGPVQENDTIAKENYTRSQENASELRKEKTQRSCHFRRDVVGVYDYKHPAISRGNAAKYIEKFDNSDI